MTRPVVIDDDSDDISEFESQSDVESDIAKEGEKKEQSQSACYEDIDEEELKRIRNHKKRLNHPLPLSFFRLYLQPQSLKTNLVSKT